MILEVSYKHLQATVPSNMHMKGEGLLGRGIQLVKSYVVDLLRKWPFRCGSYDLNAQCSDAAAISK